MTAFTSQIHVVYEEGVQTELDLLAITAVETAVLDTYFTNTFLKSLFTSIRA